MQELRQKCLELEGEIKSLRSCSKSERESDHLKRELQLLVMTMQISLAQARADLAEVRTDLDLSLKSIHTERMKKNHQCFAESRVDSSPLCVTEPGDVSSFSNSNRSEVFFLQNRKGRQQFHRGFRRYVCRTVRLKEHSILQFQRVIIHIVNYPLRWRVETQ